MRIMHSQVENSPIRAAHELDEDYNSIRLLGIIAQAKEFMKLGLVAPDDENDFNDLEWAVLIPGTDDIGEYDTLHEARIALEDYYAPPDIPELEKYRYTIFTLPDEGVFITSFPWEGNRN